MAKQTVEIEFIETEAAYRRALKHAQRVKELQRPDVQRMNILSPRPLEHLATVTICLVAHSQSVLHRWAMQF